MTESSPKQHDHGLPSVRLLLTRLVLYCLVPGVLAALLFFVYQYRENRIQQERVTEQTVHALVQAVDSHLLKAQAIAQTLARSVSLSEGRFSGLRVQAQAAIDALGEGTNVVVRDIEGNHLFNALVAPGEPLPQGDNPQQVRPVFETGKPRITDLFTGAVMQRRVSAVNVPVTVNGKVAYVLAVAIWPDYFTRVLQGQPLPPGWIAAILDSSGAVAGRSQRPELYVGKPASESLRRALHNRTAGTLVTTSLEGVPVTTVFKRSEKTGWVVAIGIPQAAWGNRDAVALLRLAAGAGVLFAIGLALAWRMGGRIADSVQSLVHPALALGRGERPQRPTVHFREALDVAKAIADAAALLEQHQAAISSRDRELEQAHRLAKFGSWLLDTRTGDVSTTGFFSIYGVEPPPFERQRGTIFTEHSWDLVDAATKKLTAEGGRYELELEGIHSSGRRIWVNAKSEAILDEQGRTIAIRGTVQDITERKAYEEMLRQADRRKDEFLAMLSHELRNPLAPIAAAADLLKLPQVPDATLKNASAIIGRQVRHMAALINDLLDASRVTRGLIALDMQPTDLRLVVDDAVEQVLPLIEARGHTLRRDTTGGGATMRGDHKRLVQVVANLLSNAVRFTPAGGDISIRIASTDTEVQLAVADNGIGMPPELVSSAFGLFVQGERSSDRSQGGLGIGLALVKSIVEMHLGRVRAESPGANAGSTFTITLPRSDARVAAPPERAAAPVTGKALKVLVVDDNIDAANTLASFVTSLGHVSRVAFSANSALELAASFVPDACVLDIGLPDMDGYELARRLLAHPATAKAKLVAVSGYGRKQDKLAAQAAGFSAYLVKPADLTELAAFLATVP